MSPTLVCQVALVAPVAGECRETAHSLQHLACHVLAGGRMVTSDVGVTLRQSRFTAVRDQPLALGWVRSKRVRRLGGAAVTLVASRWMTSCVIRPCWEPPSCKLRSVRWSLGCSEGADKDARDCDEATPLHCTSRQTEGTRRRRRPWCAWGRTWVRRTSMEKRPSSQATDKVTFRWRRR